MVDPVRPEDAVGLHLAGGIADAQPAARDREIIEFLQVGGHNLILAREGDAQQLLIHGLFAVEPFAAGVHQPVEHEAVHAGPLQRIFNRHAEIIDILLGQRDVHPGRRAVALLRMELAPEGVGADAIIAHDQHLLLVAQLDHLRQEVVLQPRLLRNGSALVPGIAVRREDKGLDAGHASILVPLHMGRGISVRPMPRLREYMLPLHQPVEINAVRAERLFQHLHLPSLRRRCCKRLCSPGGEGRNRQERHEPQPLQTSVKIISE